MANTTLSVNMNSSSGTLIGKVTVQPETAVPGQSVFVQVLGPDGKLVTDPSITVIMQGAPARSRYCQFTTPGTHTLFVTAAKGDLTETASASLTVAGTALAFRRTLALPAVTEIPILQVDWVLGAPYTANFNLGVTPGLRRVAATAIAKAASTKPETAPPTITKAVATLDSAPVAQGAPEATSYKWDFGDGQSATTQTTAVSHNYFPAMAADDVVRAFDVTCTVAHDNITVKRTLLLHSCYGLSRQGGVVVPPVTGATQTATFQHIAFSASMVVHNLENAPATLTAAAYVPFSDDSSKSPPSPRFINFKTPIVLDAKSATVLGVYAPLDTLKIAGAVVNGFTAYYSGEVKDGSGNTLPVRFSQAFRIALSDSGVINAGPADELTAAKWDLNAALLAVSAVAAGPKGPISKSGSQTMDSATNTVAIRLSADPADINTLSRAREAIQAGLTSVALKNGALNDKGVPFQLPKPAAGQPVSAPRIDLVTINPLDPPPVAAGNQCYPDDITDADLKTADAQQLVCQLTDDTMTATIPSMFQNAMQGDIILSPAPSGNGDLIAALFSVLTPPQTHSHSGMMTADYAEITHNTAAQGRYTGSLTTDVLGIPTGVQPAALQYGWPGSLTQSIDDATNTVYLADPGGTTYSLSSFDTDQQGDPFSLIYPLVVKPLPEHEEAVRATLRKAADIARSKGAQYEPGGTKNKPSTLKQKGACYYSFYAYTIPQLSAGFTQPAPADAGWATGLVPAVCSSFCWMCLKEAGVPLVTKSEFEQLSDFSPSAIANGARVGSATLDGLIYYPQAERATAGQMLYQVLLEQALNAEGGFGTLFDGGVDQLIAGPIANQILNDFAFGNADLQTNAWQTPGDGNAVSPDNTRLWNPPYYGYSEPLQYLPAHPEKYTVSKWTKVISRGSIKGTVTNNGAVVANVYVSVSDAPGYNTVTDAKGSYVLENIAIGKYALKASVVTTTDGITGERNNGNEGEAVTLTKEKPDVVKDIQLGGQLESFRRVQVVYAITGDHADRNGGQTTGWLQQGPYTNSVDVEPGKTSNTLKYTYDYNGGGYYNVAFTWVFSLLSNNAIQVELSVVMNSDNTGSDEVTGTPWSAVIEKGDSATASFTGLHYSYDGVFTAYENGPVNFNFTITNAQQTG
jgi:hypothetical protein